MKHFLSPKELAEAVGVSESTVRRWVDGGVINVSRTAGGHRRIRVSDAVQYVRDARMPLVRPGVLEMPDVSVPDAAHDDSEALYAALHDGDVDMARGLLLAWYIDGRSVAEICDGPIMSAMRRLGELWQHDKSGIYIEHRATDTCASFLYELRSLIPPVEDDAPIAAGAAPAGDPYVLPTLAAGTTLMSLGWRAINLGPDTPLDSLRQLAVDSGARLVWLSVSTQQAKESLTDELPAFARSLRESLVSLAVGGRATKNLPVIGHDNLHVVGSMAELAALATGLRQRQWSSEK